MHVETLPVWSELARDEDIPLEVAARLPEGWRLSSHQVETYKALTTGDADVIFNSAMTGDGKSLAGQLPVLIRDGKSPMMAMYPTNELVHDQQGQLAASQQTWNSQLLLTTLYGNKLDEILAEGDYRQRGDALMGVLRNHDVVLTNPDIFHLIMHQFYLFRDDARDKIIGPLMQRFEQFTFDEFHIFDIPQVISMLNALLFLDEMGNLARRHRYLFLSATPGELMLEYLDRSGLTVKEIEGRYLHTDTQPDLQRWRRILHRATIHFGTTSVEDWVKDHLDDTLLPFFLDNKPGAKGAIIVNSVAAAHRLVMHLEPVFARHGLMVKPNTGLTSRSGRSDSYAADLLVGTSTVDVGVDFQINFLLFESRDAGSFLQRLGRLGRHGGYSRNGQFYSFQKFVVHALVPGWILEALFQGRDGSTPLLEAGDTVDRECLNMAIHDAYPAAARFDDYARLWGELQTMRIMSGLSHSTIREQYKESRTRLGMRYESVFGIRLGAAFQRYQELRNTQKALLDEAESFRGGSYFACCIVDETETGPERFKTADLFLLAANAELEPLEEDRFYAAVEHAGLRASLFARDEPLAFFRFGGWRQERKVCRVFLDCNLRGLNAELFGKAFVLKGINLDAQVPGLGILNGHLSRREIPALLCPGYHPMDLKRRLRLPLLFAVHAFFGRDSVEGCVAFGREALLLEARLRHTNLRFGGETIIL